jgi:protein phosphatase PTC7
MRAVISRLAGARRGVCAARPIHAFQSFATSTSDQREYTIRVFTGDFRGAGTDAVVHASLHGTNGVSSKHTISSGDHIDKSSFFDYTIATEDIGGLESISIGHEEAERGSGWHVDRIEVHSDDESWQFDCDSWIGRSDCGGMSGPLLQQFHSSTSQAFIDQESLPAETITQLYTGVELDFFTGAMSIPHPDKVQQGMRGKITKSFGHAGEDAFCVHANKESNCHVLAVADGVFEWSLKGIDAGEYSRSLLEACLSTAEASGASLSLHDRNNSEKLLQKAWDNVQKDNVLGSCTVCFTTIDLKQGILDCANLGDSALLIVGTKKGEKLLKLRTPAQEHTFGCPYQLGHHSKASEPSDAMVVQFPVRILCEYCCARCLNRVLCAYYVCASSSPPVHNTLPLHITMALCCVTSVHT